MRHRSRELALQILFQTEFAPKISFSDLLEVLGEGATGEVIAYAEGLIQGVIQHKSEIDQKIQAASRQWKIDRMSPIDRNVMRIAVFEMVYANEILRPSIAIDEAIETVKIYGSSDSAAFVNGILDQIAKTSA